MGGKRDGKPEVLDWADTGCDLAPACLSCPLPRCRYDEPMNKGGWNNQKVRERWMRIRSFVNGGGTVMEAAAEFGVDKRTVHRAMAEHR